MADLSDILRETTEAMACFASVDMDLWNRHSNACLQAAAALAVQTQQGVEVKKLEWTDGAPGTYTEVAESPFGHYSVWEINGTACWSPWKQGYGSIVEGGLQEAKAAAQSDYETRIRSALVDVPAVESEPVATLQDRVQPWMMACFGPEISADKLERNDRFMEEALELVQASDYPKDRVLALVDYVYERDQGEINQEVGGVMITLAAHCLAHGVDMHKAGEAELARIWTKVDAIRAKQAAKPTGSALPVANPPRSLSNEGWMPIDTAPKDGTAILAYGLEPVRDPSHVARETRWELYGEGSMAYAAFKAGRGPSGAWGWHEPIHKWATSWQPTHWQPLPAPPLSTSKGSAGDGAATGTKGVSDNG